VHAERVGRQAPQGGPTEFTLPEVEAIVDEAGRVGRKVAAPCPGPVPGSPLRSPGGVASIEHGDYLT